MRGRGNIFHSWRQPRGLFECKEREKNDGKEFGGSKNSIYSICVRLSSKEGVGMLKKR